MTFYWRLKNIPELRDVAARDRREWWCEALVRSRTKRAQRISATIGIAVTVGTVFALNHSDWGLLASLLVVAGVAEWIHHIRYQQPRAREWLRLHIHDEKFD
ncbi:hypothetical protein [Rhodanobacter sp. C03]|uniref:hypothetical protein n=1 Tax=Rhodanobacter sp. C03 TaxID=1945858 RepID=UPI000985C469|nr:hypothetical protein [Rhodanobacter sp. C03]OOG54432.1 hypothetical protein B0E48_14105 [Rhodanobacter sp. C03]